MCWDFSYARCAFEFANVLSAGNHGFINYNAESPETARCLQNHWWCILYQTEKESLSCGSSSTKIMENVYNCLYHPVNSYYWPLRGGTSVVHCSPTCFMFCTFYVRFQSVVEPQISHVWNRRHLIIKSVNIWYYSHMWKKLYQIFTC